MAEYATCMPFFTYSKIFYFCVFKQSTMPISEIIRPIASEFAVFEAMFADEMQIIAKPVHGMLDGQKFGKRLRPMLVMLSAAVCSGVNDDTYNTAIAVELLHTATLFHDDVVDNAATRRGLMSLNAKWGNKSAVLIGDCLLAQAITRLTKNGNNEILSDIIDAAISMGSGELSQMHNADMANASEAAYLEIIRNKTAVLLSACCKTGAKTVNAEQEKVEALAAYGLNLGMAFQMRDDLLDYGTAEIGKPLCADIGEGKFTLPLIAHLNTLDSDQRQMVVEDVKQHRNIEVIAESVRRGPGISHTENAIRHYTELAIEQLQHLEDSDVCQALEQMALYCAHREK